MQELVRIPSVYRPEEADGNEACVARFLVDYLEDKGFEVRTEEVAPGRPNVWAVWDGDRPGKTLLFEAHTDVVTEGRAGTGSTRRSGPSGSGTASTGGARATRRGTWLRRSWPSGLSKTREYRFQANSSSAIRWTRRG